MSEALKLLAHTGDDIQILSAHAQDAVLQVTDMTYMAREKRFIVVMNRFRWENQKRNMRVRSVLNVAGVLAVQYYKINRLRSDGVLSLLALQFTEHTPPAGKLILIFAGGAQIRLDVEAPEAILEDITTAWAARTRPHHKPDEDA